MIGKVLVGAAGAVISVGLAAPAGADPVPTSASTRTRKKNTSGLLGRRTGGGLTGTDPAMLGDGYNVCWELWNQHASGTQVAAGLVRDHPQLTTDEAAHFVWPHTTTCARCPARMTIGLTAPAEIRWPATTTAGIFTVQGRTLRASV